VEGEQKEDDAKYGTDEARDYADLFDGDTSADRCERQ
jgi:hypothetical protein